MRPAIATLTLLLLLGSLLVLLLLLGDGTFASAPRPGLLGRGVQAGLPPARPQDLACWLALAGLLVGAREGGRLRLG